MFLLWHSHTITPNHDDDKLIGVYSTHENAHAAQARVADKAGFVDTPEGFQVCEYVLDRDGWVQGYATVD